jgi:hypothetical protein
MAPLDGARLVVVAAVGALTDEQVDIRDELAQGVGWTGIGHESDRESAPGRTEHLCGLDPVDGLAPLQASPVGDGHAERTRALGAKRRRAWDLEAVTEARDVVLAARDRHA